MRIISGYFKGKKISEPEDKLTRPLKDLTKESIFNIIVHSNKFKINLQDSMVLDLFSGVGSFGIECLSRGAKKVVFIENYKKVIKVLQKNLKNLNKIKNYEVFEKDIYNEKTFLNLNKKFNIIFLDPPYKDKNLKNIFFSIKKNKILESKGILILHRNIKEKEQLPNYINILEEKKYGISKIIFASFLN